MPDGSRLTLLERGGRILGLCPPGDGQNFLWTASAPREDDWNVGGDRTWISPEVDVFVPHFPDTSVFRVPPQLDPGNYRLVGEGAPRLTMRCTLPLSRLGTMAEIEISKSWTAAPDPLRAHNVRYAGYTQCTELRTPGGLVALWNIVQLPHGGEVLIPVHGRATPQIYFGEIPREDFDLVPGLIRCRAHRRGLAKFGIHPISATGRIGYLWGSGSTTNLVVRNVAVNPCARYGDVAWADPRHLDEQGCALQVCSLDNELGAYVELEHHAPMGQSDIAQLCAWRGPGQAIRTIAHQLLGAPIR